MRAVEDNHTHHQRCGETGILGRVKVSFGLTVLVLV